METVIFTLFNYGSDCREAYLLLQLFTAALRHEIKYSFHIHTKHFFFFLFFLLSPLFCVFKYEYQEMLLNDVLLSLTYEGYIVVYM